MSKKEKKQKKPKIKVGKLEKREARAGYFFTLPWVIGVIALKRCVAWRTPASAEAKAVL